MFMLKIHLFSDNSKFNDDHLGKMNTDEMLEKVSDFGRQHLVNRREVALMRLKQLSAIKRSGKKIQLINLAYFKQCIR